MAEAVAVAIADAIAADFVAAAFIESAIYVAAAVTISSVYGAQQRRKATAAYNASLKDRELMIRSAVAPRRVIYGRDKVSGPIVYAQSTGDKGQYLHLVLVLAAHECDAVEEIWFNDVKLPALGAGGFVTSGEFARSDEANTHSRRSEGVTSAGGTYTLSEPASKVTSVSIAYETGPGGTSSPLTGWAHTPGTALITGLDPSISVVVNYEWIDTSAGQPVRIKVHLGGAGQVADPDLVAESGGTWTSAHVGAGICYLAVRLEYDQEIFGQVGLPNISAVVRGKKVADPRSSTTVWSDNAALCVADWLADARYGLAAGAGEVPASEVIAAANICDETIDLEAGGATTQKRYTFNGSFTTDQAPRDVLADLLSGMAGSCIWTQGRWLVRAGAYRAPSLTITSDHLAGRGVTIVPKSSRSDLFNAVRVTYRDPDQGWAEVQAPLVTNSMYEAQDGGIRLVRSIQLPGAMDHWRAQRLGKIELERARQALTVQLTGNLRTYDLSPTDTAALTLTRYGFAGKVFEVKERTWSPDGTLPYTLRETAAGVWAWNYGEATDVDLAPDTTLPSPYLPPPLLTDLSVASGTDHLLRLSDGTVVARAWVQWTPSTSVFVLQGGRIEVQWKRDDADDWQASPALPGDAANTYLGPMPDQRAVLIRVRAVNASGRSGPWATISALIVGKTEPPGDVTGLAASVVQGGVALSWDENLESDYAETELRLGASWAAGDVIFVGKTNVHAFLDVPDGTYTVWAKHRDSSGNVSTTAAPIEFTFTAGGGISTSLRLSSTASVIAVDEAGTFTPTSVSFTAFSAFAGSPVFTCTGGTLTGTGATRTMAVSSMTGDSAQIDVAWGGQTDSETVVKVYDGTSVDVEYSVTGTGSWHSTFAVGDIYARYKRGAGAWSSAVKIVGEDGAAGDYIDYIFKRAATQPATPTGTTPAGWADAPPAADGNPLWASTAQRTAAGALVGVWSTPARISGDDARRVAARSNAGNAFLSSGSGTSWSPSLIILSRELLNGLTTSGTTSWSVTAGTFTGSLTVVNGVTGAPAGFGPSAMTSDSVTFRCTHTEAGLNYYDDITIFKARDGVTAYLSNDSISLAATNAGVVTSYSGATGVLRVVNGAGDVSTAGSALAFTIVGYTGFGSSYSAPGTSLDGGNITINPITGSYAVSGGVTTAAAQATVTLRATYTNPLGGTQTFDRVFTLGKAKDGAQGATGSPGSPGSPGATGASGSSARRSYALYSGNPSVTGAAVVKAGSALPSVSDFSPSAATSFTTTVQNPGSSQAMFQSDGIYDPVANQTTWGTPYLSNLKVGNLSAISADLGTITAGTVTGAVLRTAASGARIAMNEGADNSIKGYTAGGVQMFNLNAGAGIVSIQSDHVSTTQGALRVDTSAYSGMAISATGPAGVSAIYGLASSTGNGVKGESGGSGAGVWGVSASGAGGRFSSLRVDQTPLAGSTSTLTATTLPAGTPNRPLVWLPVNLNGTNYLLAGVLA